MSDDNTDKVKRNNPILDIASRHTKLTAAGNGEYHGRCPIPSHTDSRASFTLNADKGVFHCHGCGANGDVIALVQAVEGLTFPQALKALGGNAHPKDQRKVVAEYDYRDTNGELLFQVVRFEPKDFRQRRPGKDGEDEWIWNMKGVTRVPYRLNDIEKSTTGVFIVEGEKDADALAALGLVATCNPGGSGKWQNSYGQHFNGRSVAVIADNDKPGIAHATDVCNRLLGVAKTVRLIELPGDGKDVSDWLGAGGDADQLRNITNHAPLFAPTTPPIREPSPSKPKPKREPSVAPFKALGCHEGSYLYFSYEDHVIVRINTSGHTNKGNMLGLAPLEYWEEEFRATNGVHWTVAANACMRACKRIGQFNPSIVRGRGAWIDDGRNVLHLGNRLLIDGKKEKLHGITSKFVYESALPLDGFGIENELSDVEGAAIGKIIQRLPWQRKQDADFLLGFLFLACICGGLTWRPHLWVSGSKGSGKSWVLENIVGPLLGNASCKIVSNTTEAGVRQQLKSDALPVVFDEAEGDGKRARARIQDIVELARQASSESSASIIKGTPEGKSLSFKVRSMFLFSSINAGVEQESDDSRITLLTLKRADGGSQALADFTALQTDTNELLTQELCNAFRARAYCRLPTIRKNIKTFIDAFQGSGLSRRAAEQIGTLLAGAWSTRYSGEVDPLVAAGYIQDFNLAMPSNDPAPSDEQQLLGVLLESQIRVTGPMGSNTFVPVGELFEITQGQPNAITNIGAGDARDALARHGFKPDGTRLIISNTHSAIKGILKETPWAAGRHKQVLIRIPGSTKKDFVRFKGSPSRAISVPVNNARDADSETGVASVVERRLSSVAK